MNLLTLRSQNTTLLKTKYIMFHKQFLCLGHFYFQVVQISGYEIFEVKVHRVILFVGTILFDKELACSLDGLLLFVYGLLIILDLLHSFF